MRIEVDEDGVGGLAELLGRLREVARTHQGQPQPEVLAALERQYAEVGYPGPLDGLDLPEMAQAIADGEDIALE